MQCLSMDGLKEAVVAVYEIAEQGTNVEIE